MNYIYKEKVMIKTSKGNCIILRLSYRDNPRNTWTGEMVGKGYVVNVVPATTTNNDNGICIESFGALTGFNYLLVPCERRSKKKEMEAMAILMRRKKEFIDAIIDMHGIPVCESCGG